MKNRIVIVRLALLGLLLAAGCGPGHESLAVVEAWARPALAGENGAVYFIIVNPSGKADRLIAAAGDVAGRVEIHLSRAGENGVMMMEEQEAVLIDPGSEVLFAPGGLHIMLIGLARDLPVGETFPLRLQFENGGEIQLEVPIEER